MKDKLREIANRIMKTRDHIKTEEATKQAYIIPFIQALGYDVFNPLEVVPEFTCDVGTKKGEKVDYAIYIDGVPVILIEAKTIGDPLSLKCASQLYRYFTASEHARIGVLTDGITYRFYSDLEKSNIMDEKPFLEINMLDLSDNVVLELARMSKGSFNLDAMLDAAGELKYTRELRRIFGEQLEDPDDDFVRYFAARIYEGNLTANVRERFKPVVRRALNQYISERISGRLKMALHEETVAEREAEVEHRATLPPDDGIITTDEEMQAFQIIRAIMAEAVELQRVIMRDTKSYCGILLDDNNRKPICRLHFNSGTKRLGLFDVDKNEERIVIERLEDIYLHAPRIRATASFYE